jgi:hypothetical protein
VLAVIQHQQQLPPGKRAGQRVSRRYRRQVADSQGRGYRSRHLRRILHPGQLRQPDPVGEPADHLLRHLGGQSRLPGATWPGHRHQAILT